MKESTLQANIIKFLEKEGFLALKQQSPPAGIPDLLVCKGNFHVWIEVKTSKGVLTNIQRACHLKLKKKNQLVFTCRSIHEVCAVLEIFPQSNEK